MNYRDNYQAWLRDFANDQATISELQAIAGDEKEVEDRFYKNLSFGTAGMRGVLGAGMNRMNVYTVRRATQGLADFLTEEEKKRGVVIGYDSRRMSPEFALETALVLCANGVTAYLFDALRPVALLSFGVRHLHAAAGVVITASHNPPQYNGYKVYGEDGAQLGPEAAAAVTEKINALSFTAAKRMDEAEARAKGLLHIIGNKEVDDDYIALVKTFSIYPQVAKEAGPHLKIVYTPIHGSGNVPVRRILREMGMTNVSVVKEQEAPDPNFSTVRVPNPEEADTLRLGVKLADEIGSDVVIGTDPDADRMGIAIRDDNGKFVLLNGNQIGVLLADYIFKRKTEENVMPKNGALVKTIVTTELARKVATSYGVTTFDVLTGFKFIGEKIKEWEENGKYTYLFGFEESYGSLVGTHARDKDAVVASMIFAEMICYYDSIGKRVYDVLQDIYKQFGYFVEKAKSITFGGLDGMQKMADIMTEIRSTSFSEIAGTKVLAQSDFVTRKKTYADGKTEDITLPKTNAFKIHLDNGDWICVRPSGTEPKLKFYVATSKPTQDAATALADNYLAYMENLVK